MNFKEHIKENVWELVSFIIISILPFLIYHNIIFNAFIFIVTLFFSVKLFYFEYQSENRNLKLMASLKFFSSYLLKLNDGLGFKQSYESSIKSLIGYYDIVSYDNILENLNCPYDLKRYNSYFIYTLKKEKINEIQLPNYIPLQEDIDEDINDITKAKTKAKKEKNVSIVLVLFSSLFVILIKIFNSTIFETINKYYIKYLLVFIEISILPLIEYVYVSKLERTNNDV